VLTIIFAESALETVPEALWSSPDVQKHAEKREKKPGQILLDRSYHHRAMTSLRNASQRGRPDIVHISLLEALGSPLNMEKLLRVYVHTVTDYVISLSPEVRLPRNYDRFIGLMEQLFEFNKIPPTGVTLISLKKQTLAELISEIKVTRVIALTRLGKLKLLDGVMSELVKEKKPAMIIGGFPHGNFSEDTMKLVDEAVCFDREMLETWTVTSRAIYEYEKAIELPQKRLKKISGAA